jgi:hypothetical protein
MTNPDLVPSLLSDRGPGLVWCLMKGHKPADLFFDVTGQADDGT